MSETAESLTIDYEEDGQLLVKELGKVILSKGAWCTVLFRYQEWRNASQDYGPEKYAIRRYNKQGGEYKLKSKFVISSLEQAKKINEALGAWIKEAESTTKQD